jgi:hypothetical protein
MTPEGQNALLKVWADGTNFALDPKKQPKAEFARLAKVKGWVSGDKQWQMHWQACFGEVYPYISGGKDCTFLCDHYAKHHTDRF